jgi:hypothetical protein
VAGAALSACVPCLSVPNEDSVCATVPKHSPTQSWTPRCCAFATQLFTPTHTHLHALLRAQCQALQDAVDAQRARQQQRRRKRQRPLRQKHLQCATQQTQAVNECSVLALLCCCVAKHTKDAGTQALAIQSEQIQLPRHVLTLYCTNTGPLLLLGLRLAGRPLFPQLPHQLPHQPLRADRGSQTDTPT